VIGSPLWKRLSPAEQTIFAEEFAGAADRASAAIRASEQKLPEWFKAQGKTVVTPNLAAFRAAAVPLHNDASAGAGWTKEQYDRLQAIK
jgi:TRAP-type C4-dicarboxylate transport system substrate-binding protein